MGPDPSLTPELVQAQAFTTAFRGFDHAEVREFLGRVAAQIRALNERAEYLESAWHSAEERASRPPSLDEDTLVAAVGEETAAVLRAARAAAAELRSKASEEGQRIIAEARSSAEQIRADAETLHERHRKAAEEAAATAMDAARSEASALVERARVEAEAVKTAAEHERALTIEGATATRDRILEDLSRRRRVASVQIEQLRAGRERLLDAYGVVRRTLEEVHEELTRADAEARAAADQAGRRMQRELDEALRVAAQVPAATALDGEATVDPESAEVGPAETQVVEHVEAQAEPEGEQGSAVDALFARIRASHEEPDADAESPQGEEEAPVAVAAESDGDEARIKRREAALGDIEVSMGRRLKRTMQDEQNAMLDRLRGRRGQSNAKAVLPDKSAQVAGYVDSLMPFVERAVQAGRSFATEELGLDGQAATGDSPALGDLVREPVAALIDGLRRRLYEAVEATAGADQAVVVEAIGSGYREWKSRRVETLAGDLAIAAFSAGTLQMVPGETSVRWVVEDPAGPCPDCDDDALAGDIAKGETFPTGQLHPPAHSGCRCLLVPVTG